MPQLGPLEIAVVLLIALLVFGPNRLPQLAKQAGGMLKELRKIQNNIKQDLSQMMSDESDESDATDVSDGAAPPPSLPPLAETTDVPDVTNLADVTDATESPAPPSPPPPPPPVPPQAD